MLQVYDSTHRDLKALAAKAGLSIKDYMKMIVDELKGK